MACHRPLCSRPGKIEFRFVRDAIAHGLLVYCPLDLTGLPNASFCQTLCSGSVSRRVPGERRLQNKIRVKKINGWNFLTTSGCFLFFLFVLLRFLFSAFSFISLYFVLVQVLLWLPFFSLVEAKGEENK